MIVVACSCGARSDQDGPEAQLEDCWSCADRMADTGIRWNCAVPIGEVARHIVAGVAARMEKAS